MVEVHLVAVQADRLADAKTIAKHRQNEKVIAGSMTPGLGGVEQAAISLSLRKSLPRSWVSAAAAVIVVTISLDVAYEHARTRKKEADWRDNGMSMLRSVAPDLASRVTRWGNDRRASPQDVRRPDEGRSGHAGFGAVRRCLDDQGGLRV
jgi:hypothetical protein